MPDGRDSDEDKNGRKAMSAQHFYIELAISKAVHSMFYQR